MEQGRITIEQGASVRDAALVSLFLEDYQDIFSDFDPRPFTQRALSDDFLVVLRKVVRDTPKGGIELRLMIPKAKRVATQEQRIRRRLREHFAHQFQRQSHERSEIITRGMIFLLVGVLLMGTATFFLLEAPEGFVVRFFLFLLEPASWFLFWEGSNQIIFTSGDHKTERLFSKRMAKAQILFTEY